MNRSRFMSLPVPLPPARWPGARPPALAPAPAPAPAPAMEPLGTPAGPDDLPRPAGPTSPDRRKRAPIPVLRLGLTLAPGQAGILAEAVLARVLTCNRAVGTVVLDLGAGTEADAATCDALHALDDRLHTLGTRLRLVAGSVQVRDGLRDGGLTHRLGSGAIHPSLRAAVLATYAGLPGPGLVIGDVREALAAPAEPLGLPPRLPGLAAWPGP
jgi:hypothetical protein